MQLRGNLVEDEVVLSLKTTFSVGVGGWVAGENKIKAISSSKFKLKLKMSLAKLLLHALHELHSLCLLFPDLSRLSASNTMTLCN